MKFNIITIFPDIFDSYFSESIVKRAQKGKLIDIKIHNLRDWTQDKHKTVDDTPYGGGAGMVIKVEPVYRCVEFIKSEENSKFLPTGQAGKIQNSKLRISPPEGGSRTILFSAKGKKYTQKDAERLKKYNNLILICGRYEGVDERVAKYVADEEISIGDYVLTGGEIPAMVLVDSIARLMPGVLGNADSLKEESFSEKNKNSFLEYPQFTKPAEFNSWKVPEVLLGGNHAKIKEWRKKFSKQK